MTKDAKTRILVYGIVGLVLCLGGGGWWHHLRIERAYANAWLVHSLSEISLAESTLRLIDEGRLDTARQILKMRIDRSVGTAEEMTEYGAKMYPLAWPNLREGLHRAAERARREGNITLADRLEKVAAKLEARDRQGGISWTETLL